MTTRREVKTLVSAAMNRVAIYAKKTRCPATDTIDNLRTVLDSLQDTGYISSYDMDLVGNDYPDEFTLTATLLFKENSKPVVVSCVSTTPGVLASVRVGA